MTDKYRKDYGPGLFRWHDKDLRLSPRELSVAESFAKGMDAKEIAVQLNIGEGTVESRRRTLYLKFNAHKRDEFISHFSEFKASFLPDAEP